MNIKIVFISMAILAAGSIANAERVLGVDGLSPEVEAETELLAPKFEELNSILSDKLEKKPELKNNPKKIIELAKKELGIKCIGACLTKDKLLRKAIKLFVALDSTVDKCDTESFEILAKNSLIKWVCTSDDAVAIISQVLDHYHELHARHCWDKHMFKFKDLSKSVPQGIAEKLLRAFSTLNIGDFGYYYSDIGTMLIDIGLVGVRVINFHANEDNSALRKVAGQLKREQGLTQENPGKVMDAGELKLIIEESLLEPCRVFRKQLGSLMDAARFDAAIKNKYQRTFIYGDEKFYYALITNRLCTSLLNDGTKLYEPMTSAWNNALFV